MGQFIVLVIFEFRVYVNPNLHNLITLDLLQLILITCIFCILTYHYMPNLQYYMFCYRACDNLFGYVKKVNSLHSFGKMALYPKRENSKAGFGLFESLQGCYVS